MKGCRKKSRDGFRIIATVIAAICLGFPVFLKAGTGETQNVAVPRIRAVPIGPLTAKFLSWPRWRGFNLLEKFHKDWSNGPYSEDDFRMISELGFNFVRLPMDYRVWCRNGDWNRIDETVLKEIDQAVAWGQKYRIHVSLNFHRGPGYTVADPKERTSLWTDPAAQKMFVRHWTIFAKRYRKVSPENLSFNLLNEPAGSSEDRAAYIEVVRKTVKAIRRIDPDRTILVDGFGYGREYLSELDDLDVIQSTRGYEPFQLTHYKASWVQGSSSWAVPSWPPQRLLSWYLYGPNKPEFQSTIELAVKFPAKTFLKIRINQVSQKARLVVKADGKIVLDRVFAPGPGSGEWTKVQYMSEWDIYQNLYDLVVTAEIPAGTSLVTIGNVEGDWLTFTDIRLIGAGGKETVLPPDTYDWGAKQSGITLDADGVLRSASTVPVDGRLWLKQNVLSGWTNAADRGCGVFVGEWGAFQVTPHNVVLSWMKDCLENWQDQGFGWALWNFRGSFGILDSGRTDMVYEDWNGHKLDRAMLDILQAH
jgi:aryl-phospho-beta-D-glucosidase BglC (GH1 family)